MNVAFCINRLALVGLGPTLVSMLRNCSDNSKLTVYILCADLNTEDKEKVSELLESENFLGQTVFFDFDPEKHFGNLRPLHGDRTTYGRLLLPELVDKSFILYLDSDVIVEIDVLDAIPTDLENHAFAAVKGGPIQYALECNFYINELHIRPDKVAFNAGVLLLNLVKWREEKLKEKCLTFASAYPNKLLSCDQTILNALYAGNFAYLPQNFNCKWYAYDNQPQTSEKMIFHFVGSPKPWDILGKHFHKGYHIWKKYLTQNWKVSYNRPGFKDLQRAWKIRRSYFKVLKNRLLK